MPLAILAEWIGATGHRLALLAAGGLVAGVWATGTVAIPLAVVPALLLSTAIATILVLLCQLQLGYAAAWTGSSAPLFWIWQKMTFILGGVMIPLTLYPAPYGSLAAASPFAAMFFAPASFLLDGSPRAILATLAPAARLARGHRHGDPADRAGRRGAFRRAWHMRSGS